jgi:hypothetical protein
MDGTTDLPGTQTLDGTALAVIQQPEARAAQIRQRAALALWVLGFLLLVGASLLVFFPPAPWAIDLPSPHHLAAPATLVLGEYPYRLGQYRG